MPKLDLEIISSQRGVLQAAHNRPGQKRLVVKTASLSSPFLLLCAQSQKTGQGGGRGYAAGHSWPASQCLCPALHPLLP